MNCPKCECQLEECPEPEQHIIEGGNDVTLGGQMVYQCPNCEACWTEEDLEGEKDE